MAYEIYLEDYYLEALNVMYRALGMEETGPLMDESMNSGMFWEDDVWMEAKDKSEVYKINYILRDELQLPKIHTQLQKKAVRDKIVEFTGEFIDTHHVQLSTSGPVHIFTFGDKETSVLYNLFDTSADMMLALHEKVVAETYYGKISKFFTGWIKNAPHKILLTAILIDSLQNGYDDIVECMEYLWAFAEYPLVFREYWKIGVKEDVMDYTIEHLGSKYKIRSMKTIKELLKYHATLSVNSNADRLKTGADNVYYDFAQRMRNQINNSFRNISRAYYDNVEKNNTLHKKDSTFDDGTLADQEGYTTLMSQIINNTIDKFATNSINDAYVGAAAEASQVDKSNLTGYLNQIWSTKDNKLHKFVEDIIQAYFEKNPTATSIGGGEFLNFGIALYRSISGSKDPLYQEIRKILDYWVYNVIDIKQFYNREGTIINYTRAIFNYIILMIMYYN